MMRKAGMMLTQSPGCNRFRRHVPRLARHFVSLTTREPAIAARCGGAKLVSRQRQQDLAAPALAKVFKMGAIRSSGAAAEWRDDPGLVNCSRCRGATLFLV
jgi:hypothetical protein